MSIRVVRFQSKNPLVVIGVLAAVLALLVFFLSAALAVAAGVAVLGGAGLAVRRLLGGRTPVRGEVRSGQPAMYRLDPANEVHERPAGDMPRLPPTSPDVGG